MIELVEYSPMNEAKVQQWIIKYFSYPHTKSILTCKIEATTEELARNRFKIEYGSNSRILQIAPDK